jgi:hypothetical protein
MNDVALMGTFSLVIKRTENTSIFVVRIFFALTHLFIISSLAKKNYSLNLLVLKPHGSGSRLTGTGNTGGKPQFSYT